MYLFDLEVADVPNEIFVDLHNELKFWQKKLSKDNGELLKKRLEYANFSRRIKRNEEWYFEPENDCSNIIRDILYDELKIVDIREKIYR